MGRQLAGSSAVFRLSFLGFLSLWRSSYERALCLQDRSCASYTALNNGREASKNTRSLVHGRIWKALRGNLATRGAWKSRVSRCIFSRGNIVSGCLLPERLLTERFAQLFFFPKRRVDGRSRQRSGARERTSATNHQRLGDSIGRR